MEFIQITGKNILIYADTENREKAIRKIIERFLETIEKIQLELK